MKLTFKTGLVLLACSAFAGGANAQSSDLIDVTARVLKNADNDLALKGDPGDFGTIFIPKSEGNTCVYKLGQDSKGTVTGSGGGANPEPGQCKFDGAPRAPKITVTGEPNASVNIRVSIQLDDNAKDAQLFLAFDDGSDEYVYPHFQDDKGLSEFTPEIALTVPNTATEFDGGNVGTIIADVSY